MKMSCTAISSSPPAPIECRNLWRLYGSNADIAFANARAGSLTKSEIEARFGCVFGVANVSFSVAEGETFCIMGLSGSGKSTLLRHINRLIEPTSGNVLINGVDISFQTRRELEILRSRKIGMVFQHTALWPHRTVRDNTAYALEVRGVDKRSRYEAAERALEQVRLGGWKNRYPDELSGGMQQRVGLARAMVANPDILLMDEPFSALDPLIRRELQTQFKELVAAARKTTLFVTHDLEEAVRLGDRIAIMKDGEFVQVGTPEEILLNPSGDYVRAFVQNMSKLRLTTANHLMQQLDGDGTPGALDGAPRAIQQTSFEHLVHLATKSDQPIIITDGDAPIGVVTRKRLLEAVKSDLALD